MEHVDFKISLLSCLLSYFKGEKIKSFMCVLDKF